MHRFAQVCAFLNSFVQQTHSFAHFRAFFCAFSPRHPLVHHLQDSKQLTPACMSWAKRSLPPPPTPRDVPAAGGGVPGVGAQLWAVRQHRTPHGGLQPGGHPRCCRVQCIPRPETSSACLPVTSHYMLHFSSLTPSKILVGCSNDETVFQSHFSSPQVFKDLPRA